MRLVRVVNVVAVVVARPVIEAVAAGSVAASAAVVRGTVVDEPVLVLSVEVVVVVVVGGEIVVVGSCQTQPNCGLTGQHSAPNFLASDWPRDFFEPRCPETAPAAAGSPRLDARRSVRARARHTGE